MSDALADGAATEVAGSPRTLGTWVRHALAHSRSVAGIFVAIAILWIVFSILTNWIFVSDRNLINLLRQTSVTALVTLGMMVVVVQGEIDLSVGSFLGLCATVIALMEGNGSFSPIVTALAAVVLGIGVGFVNGALVAKLGLPAFVATLGGMLTYRGLSTMLSGGRTLSGISDEFRFPGEGFITGPLLWLFLAAALLLALWPLRHVADPLRRSRARVQAIFGAAAVCLLAWASLSYRGLPMPVAITLIAALILSWCLKNTVWGRHNFAVGGNRSAARVAGIAITGHLIAGFVLTGFLTAVAAILFVGRLGAAPPEAGLFLELNAISAVVIGGASLYGGSGTVLGVLLGALLMQSLSNGLSLLNVPSAYQNIASGLVLVVAVYLDAVSKRGGRPFLRQ
jgi:D-xylose transport system permease protein